MEVGGDSVSSTLTIDPARTSQMLRLFWSEQVVRIRVSLSSHLALRMAPAAPFISTGAELGWLTSKIRRICRGGRGKGGLKVWVSGGAEDVETQEQHWGISQTKIRAPGSLTRFVTGNAGNVEGDPGQGHKI